MKPHQADEEPKYKYYETFASGGLRVLCREEYKNEFSKTTFHVQVQGENAKIEVDHYHNDYGMEFKKVTEEEFNTHLQKAMEILSLFINK